MAAVTVRKVSKSFGDFYVPRYEIVASTGGLAPGVLRDVTQVTYNDSTTDIDSFDLTVNNWDPVARDFKYVAPSAPASATRRCRSSSTPAPASSSCGSATAANS